ncbi:MAG: glycosyltransferase [Deltaproteobacteria bacterium]|jgi:glycosyltransferase involved in cell wall biosynthesis|nr:glycosyltransferase [Deltaproteobacteria bacterium]
MKKIFVLANTHWPLAGTSGGEAVLKNIFIKVADRANVTFFTHSCYKDYLSEEIKSAEYRLTTKLYDIFTILPSYIFRTLNAVIYLLFNNRYDVFYTASDFFPDVIPAFFFKKGHNKWIQSIFHLYSHYSIRKGNILINGAGYYLQRLSLYLIKQRADLIIVDNRMLKEELHSMGFDKRKIIVSPAGINIDHLQKVPAISGYTCTFLGRLHPTKGIFDLVEIWKIVCSNFPDAKIAFIGRGQEEIKAELIERINDAGLQNNIDLLGFLPSHEAFGFIKSSSVFLFPSHEEGWGIAIADAMACQVPVITWDLPVFDDVFENYIIKISENNIDQFADTVIDLLKNNSKRKNIAKSGFRFIQKYNSNKIAEDMMKVILSESPLANAEHLSSLEDT